jgi:histidinol-phosphatase
VNPNEEATNALELRLPLAIDAAREAGRIILEHFLREGLEIERKPDASPVTVADREAERSLRARIAREFPEDSILGEELGETRGSGEFWWILDPIDGTVSFVHGVPLFGTLIGIGRGRESDAGVILLPALDELVYAQRDRGAWWMRAGRTHPARVSPVSALSEALVCTTSGSTFDDVGRADAYEKLRTRARSSRGWGDCYGYVLVATGRADVMLDPRMHVWDTAALQPIVEEAGGRFADWTGAPTIHGKNAVATNGHLLDEVLACLRSD